MNSPRYLLHGFAAGVIGVASVFLPSYEALAQRPLGVDVSSFQGGSINWTNVKSDGVSFAWAKATEGTIAQGYHVDADFTVNETRGKAAGVYMGAYHFAHPAIDTPAAEASFFWSTAGSYILADGKTLMPMLDMEVFSGVDGASSYSTWANDWCVDIVSDAAAAGVSIKPAIYVSACNACQFNSSVSQWYSDIADYNGGNVFTGTPWTTCTSCEVWGSGVWHFWQVSSTGSISGISGNVDLDGYNGTLAGLQSTMIATAASSPIYYWDPQGTAGANPYTSSMTGTWETSHWSTGSGGQASPVGWVDGKAACFGVHTGIGTPAFTVTMNSSHVVAGIFDGPLTPNACPVTITGAGVINLADGPQGVAAYNSSDNASASVTINTQIAGSGQLVAEWTGQIFLHGTNTYSGGTQLGFSTNQPFSGIVNFNNGSAFGSGPITLTSFGNGGALSAEGTVAITIPNDFTLASSTTNNFVGTTGGVTYSGDWTMSSHVFNFETGNTAGKIDNISGTLSGSVGFTVSDAGTLILSGTNTYTGTTTIVSPAVFTIGGAGKLGSGTYSGAIVNGGTFNYSSSASQTLSGVISGAGPLKQTSTGTLILSGANTYTGVSTLAGGTLQLKHAEAAGTSGPLGKQAATAASTIVLSGGTLQYTSVNTNDYSGRFSTAAGQAYKIDVNGQDVKFVTALNSSGGALTLNDTAGGGSLTLSASNTYAGNTTIAAGTLALGSAASINNSATISIAAGATLDVSAISAYAIGASSTLSAAGTTNPATVIGGTTIDLGSRLIVLTYDGADPALVISQGTLVLNGNHFTVNGSVLPVGTYVLVQQATGNITTFGIFSVTGTAVGAPGTMASISVVGGNVVLTIINTTTTTLGTLVPSTYGQLVTFTATVAPTPLDGTVQFVDNGLLLGSPVAVSNGTASYSLNTLAVGNHPISAGYSGGVNFAASATTNSSIQQVMLASNTVPVTISGSTMMSDGTLQLSFSGIPGYTYLIQSATNLTLPIDWTTLSTNVADINGQFNFTDISATNYIGRYYRTAVQ